MPDPISGMPLSLDATVAGLVSEAEHTIRSLNNKATPALAPLARLLLRTESIASSKVEGMQLGVRELARAEARAYLQAVHDLTEQWRGQLAASPSAPRRGAAAWAVIDVLPAHPMITAPVAAAATGRAKAAIYQAIEQLESAGVLVPLSESRRNQAWEAAGLLDIIAGLEAGRLPPPTP